MSKELIQALNQLADKFGMAVDWTGQNVLPYMQELMSRIIRFEVITSAFWLFWGMLHLLSTVLWMKLFRYAQMKCEEDKWSDWDFGRYCVIGGMVVTIIIGLLIIACQCDDILRCVMLPESIILRYIRGAS